MSRGILGKASFACLALGLGCSWPDQPRVDNGHLAGAAPAASSGSGTRDPIPGEATMIYVDLIHRASVGLELSSGTVGFPYTSDIADGRVESSWHPDAKDPAPYIDIALPDRARPEDLSLALAKPVPDCRVRVSQGEVLLCDLTTAKQPSIRCDIGHGIATRPLRVAFACGAGTPALAVAEVNLHGRIPTSELLPQADPVVEIHDDRENAIEGLPPSIRAIWQKAPFASLAALCEAQMAEMRPLVAASSHDNAYAPSASCRSFGAVRPEGGGLRAPFRRVFRVTVGEDEGAQPTLLVAETDTGWYPASALYESGEMSDLAGSCDGTELDSLQMVGDEIWLVVTRHRALVGAFLNPYNETGQILITCRLSDKLRCRQLVIGYGEKDGSWAWARYMRVTAAPFHPERWMWTRSVALDERSRLRLGPCVDSHGAAVECKAASVLGS